ncbi:cupin domain-containing protein [Siccirubricoccus deserti]|uniref:Cupin domain-containing protein n=1 Tax=Siccirubricoccus deserti TaxID=2013562 RepID=A0A9X0R4S5_9PROT|nr:cupin domain-containing protein [Siccirubricoccus deserti]MBC4018863.1 cupin domain-containing protein [Siccirubricoccus deserti]
MILRLTALALGLSFAAANPLTAQTADPHTGHHGARPSVSTVNGAVPPGIIRGLEEVTVVLDTLTSDGQRLVITRGIRRAGTRVGIHVHQHGGHTCVLSGTITDFVEGKPNSVWPAGTCYYMPANTPMSAANLGTEDAVLMDTFQLPPGAPTITIVEPGAGQ